MFCISIRTQTGRRLINQYYYGNWIKVCVCAFPQVLIFDRFGQDIISPLLSVKELRDMGITLHLWETNTLIEQTDKTNDCWSITLSFCVCVFSLLHSDRDPIPDVPAIYFVMPTEENIDRICQVKSVLSVPWFPAQASEPSVCVCVCWYRTWGTSCMSLITWTSSQPSAEVSWRTLPAQHWLQMQSAKLPR